MNIIAYLRSPCKGVNNYFFAGFFLVTSTTFARWVVYVTPHGVSTDTTPPSRNVTFAATTCTAYSPGMEI